MHFGSADVKKKARHCGAKDIFKSKNKTLQCQNSFWKCGCQKKKGTPLWREGHFQVKKTKHFSVKMHFGSADVKKRHATVARRAFIFKFFKSKNKTLQCQNTFWKCGCQKKGTPLWREGHFQVKKQNTSVSKCILEVRMSKKKGTPLWREGHFQVKKTKHFSVKMHFGSADVKKRHATVARRAFIFKFFKSKNKTLQCQNTFWKCGCQKRARHCGAKDIFKSKNKTLQCQNAFWKCGCQKRARHCGAKGIFKSKNKTLQCQNAFWKCGCQKKARHCGAKGIFKSKNKTLQCQNSFWKCGCQKRARHCGAKGIFKSKNKTLQCQNAFWKCGCQKKARHCGAKGIFKSKNKTLQCQKLSKCILEVRMSKKGTPLWRESHFQVKKQNTSVSKCILEGRLSKNATWLWSEAHFQVKMYKTPQRQRRSIFGSADGANQLGNAKDMRGLEHIWRFCESDNQLVK